MEFDILLRDFRLAKNQRISTGLLDLFFRAGVTLFSIKKDHTFVRSFYGAGDEARTRYLHLGKVALYRMSYTREDCGYYSNFF